MLRHWVEFHYYDFERDPNLLEKLRAFVCSVKTKTMQKWVMSIHRALQKKEEEKPLQNIKLVFDKHAERVEWHIATKKEDYYILTVWLFVYFLAVNVVVSGIICCGGGEPHVW